MPEQAPAYETKTHAPLRLGEGCGRRLTECSGRSGWHLSSPYGASRTLGAPVAQAHDPPTQEPCGKNRRINATPAETVHAHPARPRLKARFSQFRRAFRFRAISLRPANIANVRRTDARGAERTPISEDGTITMAESITFDEVREMAEYARIGMTNDEISQATRDLNSIIASLERITEYDLEGVEPTFHPIGGLSNIMREDAPSPEFPQAVALANAPSQKDGFFLIPSILGEESDLR